jgi:zinc protease
MILTAFRRIAKNLFAGTLVQMTTQRLISGVAAVFFTLSLGGLACSHVQVPAMTSGEITPLVGAYKVVRYTLPNGLRLLVVEDHTSPTFSYETWFRVGSRDEFVGKTGLAHLFEHLMFKATTHYKEGEFDRILESAGVEDENAFTSWDYTAYVQELPKDKLSLIAKLESDRMVNLVVNDQSFKTEREVVLNERRFRTENSPDGTLFQELFGLAYEKNSYHWPVIGYQEDLNAMTAQEPRDFYKAYYSPNHATIAVSGDVNPEDVFNTIKTYYGKIQSQQSPVHEIVEEPEQTSPRRKSIKLNIQVEKLLMAYHVPNVMSEDTPVLNVLSSVLSGGKSSRLNRALVDTGIAGGVDANPLEMKGPGLFIISASLQQGKHSTQAESIILRELQRIAKRGVTDSELTRAKNGSDFGFYEGLDSNSDRTNFLGRYESIAHSFEDGVRLHQAVQGVKSDDVVRIVEKYFNPNSRSVVTGVKQ